MNKGRSSQFPESCGLFQGGGKLRRELPFLRRFLVSTMVLLPLFLGIMGFFWIDTQTTDFREDPAWLEAIWAVLGFFMATPILFATQFTAPFGVPHGGYVFAAVGLDAIFWAFVGAWVLKARDWWFRWKERSVAGSG